MSEPRSVSGLTIQVDSDWLEVDLACRRDAAHSSDTESLITVWGGELICPADMVGLALDQESGTQYDLRDVVLAEGRFATLDLWRCHHAGESPVEVLDNHSQDFVVFCDMFDPDGDLLEEFSDPAPSGLLICHQVSVPEAFRGRKFGLLLMASVIAELGLDRLPVCTPGAFGVPDEDRDRVIDRNQVIWEAFGFERYTDDVWWLSGSPEGSYARMDYYALLATKARPITLP